MADDDDTLVLEVSPPNGVHGPDSLPGPDPVDDPPPPPPDDGEAPFGRKPNGEPYQRDPSRYRKRTSRAKAKKATAKKAAPRPSSSSSGSSRKRGDYTETVAGLLQMVGMPLAVYGSQGTTPAHDAALADAAAIGMHTPGIAGAVNEIAQRQPAVAAVLERLAAVGPYGAIITAVTPLVLQLMVNHGALPLEVAEPMGAVDPAAIVAEMRKEPSPAPA